VATQPWEQRMFSDANPHAELRDVASPNVPVTANNTAVAPNGFIAFQPPPTHKHVDRVMNGPRGLKDQAGNPTGLAIESKWFNDWEAALELPKSDKFKFVKTQGTSYQFPDGRTHSVGRFIEKEVRY
jgi:hypothetical protein